MTEAEEIRGIPDAKLKLLGDGELVCVALARLMEAQGVEDDVLIKELYERGKQPPVIKAFS